MKIPPHVELISMKIPPHSAQLIETRRFLPEECFVLQQLFADVAKSTTQPHTEPKPTDPEPTR